MGRSSVQGLPLKPGAYDERLTMDIVVLRRRSDTKQVDTTLMCLAVQVFSISNQPGSNYVIDASGKTIIIALRLTHHRSRALRLVVIIRNAQPKRTGYVLRPNQPGDRSHTALGLQRDLAVIIAP